MRPHTKAPSAPPGAVFQAPTCRSLGLKLEVRLRNTTRRLGSGSRQEATEPIHVELRVYRAGELVFSRQDFGCIVPGGTLIVREADLSLPGQARPEEELLFVARLHKPSASEGFFSQEHQIVYTHPGSGGQAHLLYDQQPLRAAGTRPAP